MVDLFPGIVTAFLNVHNYVVQDFLQQIRDLLQKLFEPIVINHIRAHSGLPGLVDQKNGTAECLMVPVFISPVEKHQA